MHTISGVIIVALLAYLGTMFDNFFAFAAQLLVTDPSRFRRVSWAQALGVATLILIAAAVGSFLTLVPLPWVGLLSLAPFALGVYAFRQRAQPPREQFRRGAITTFAMTLALGGDNLAVWIPLLRANGVFHAVITVAIFALLEFFFLVGARSLVSHPRIVSWGSKYAPSLLPWVYFGLGVLILIECGSF
ncbi:MAG: cadmium resistance transporter [Acidimicrobiales bacterium]